MIIRELNIKVRFKRTGGTCITDVPGPAKSGWLVLASVHAWQGH